MLTLWKSCQSWEPIWSLRCFFTGAERPLSLSSSFLSFCPPIMQEEEAEGSLVLTPGILAPFWWSSRHRCSGRNAPRPGPQTEIKPETFLPSSHCADHSIGSVYDFNHLCLTCFLSRISSHHESFNTKVSSCALPDPD